MILEAVIGPTIIIENAHFDTVHLEPYIMECDYISFDFAGFHLAKIGTMTSSHRPVYPIFLLLSIIRPI